MLIEYPNITESEPEAALRQVQRYLFQLADTLRFAVNDLDKQVTLVASTAESAQAMASKPSESPTQIFGKVKDLIIKSADIVESYYEQINTRLSGSYVAYSDFGVFQQETNSQIKATSEKIEQNYQNVQTILQDLNSAMIEVNAYIRTGLLDYVDGAVPVYGVEIGQQNTVLGVVEFQRFARLTSDRLSFFDSNDTEIAYIGDYQMNITNADIGSLTAKNISTTHINLGDYILQVTKDGHLTLS